MGRLSVFEVIPVVDVIQHAIVKKEPANVIRDMITDLGYPTLLQDGIAKARAGATSVDEVMRAVFTTIG